MSFCKKQTTIFFNTRGDNAMFKKSSNVSRSILCLFFLFIAIALISSCSSSTSQPESKSTAQPEKKPVSAASATTGKLKVKGFYLGMSIEEAIQRCKESFPDAKKYRKQTDKTTREESACLYDPPDKESIKDSIIPGKVGGGNAGVEVKFNDEKKASDISLSASAFDAEGMKAPDFAKKFMDAYGLPELKPIDNEYWQYISPAGERVKVIPSPYGVYVTIDYAPKTPKPKFN
jgi:hypothetical protein